MAFWGPLELSAKCQLGQRAKAALESTATSRQAGEVMWREVAIPAVQEEKRGNSLLLVL